MAAYLPVQHGGYFLVKRTARFGWLCVATALVASRPRRRAGVMAEPRTWTDGEVLDLVRAVLVVRDAGLMQRMQAVWGGGESAGLSPLSGFFKGQARGFDLFGFGHEAGAEFWSRIPLKGPRG